MEQAEREADVGFLDGEVTRALEQTKDGLERVTTIVRATKEFSHRDGGEQVKADINRALASTIIVARSAAPGKGWHSRARWWSIVTAVNSPFVVEMVRERPLRFAFRSAPANRDRPQVLQSADLTLD